MSLEPIPYVVMPHYSAISAHMHKKWEPYWWEKVRKLNPTGRWKLHKKEGSDTWKLYIEDQYYQDSYRTMALGIFWKKRVPYRKTITEWIDEENIKFFTPEEEEIFECQG